MRRCTKIDKYEVCQQGQHIDIFFVLAWAAARLTRGCGEQAFGEVNNLLPFFHILLSFLFQFLSYMNDILQVGRAVTTSDMVSNIHPVFNRLYEGETSL